MEFASVNRCLLCHLTKTVMAPHKQPLFPVHIYGHSLLQLQAAVGKVGMVLTVPPLESHLVALR